METLERHYIAIDSWTVLFPARTTFLLSHLHTDHATMPKSFLYPVYASEATHALIGTIPQIRAELRPDCWYRTHQEQIPFKVYKTMHTAESIGFFFPSLSVLYMGDCVQSIIPLIHRPLTVIYDGLYEHVTRPLPTPSQSCALIQHTLSQQCPVLQLVHHGILSFIAASCRTMFRLHSSTPTLVRNAARYLQLVDDHSPYLLVGRSYTEGPRIVPSSYWFMRQPTLEPRRLHIDGEKLRVFCTLHARAADISAWKATHPYAHFEVLATTPV